MGIFTEKANDNIEGYTPEGTLPETKKRAKNSSNAIRTNSSPDNKFIPGKLCFLPQLLLETTNSNFLQLIFPKRIPASPLCKKIWLKKKGLNLIYRERKRSWRQGNESRPLSCSNRSNSHLLKTQSSRNVSKKLLFPPMRKVIAQRSQSARKLHSPHLRPPRNRCLSPI